MNYKRLFLDWLKKNDPENKFEYRLSTFGKTLKYHIKNNSNYSHLIIFDSFCWIDTPEGGCFWNSFHANWVLFCSNWMRTHRK